MQLRRLAAYGLAALGVAGVAGSGEDTFTLQPGRYRVSLEGWRERQVRELSLNPGAEQRITFRLP